MYMRVLYLDKVNREGGKYIQMLGGKCGLHIILTGICKKNFFKSQGANAPFTPLNVALHTCMYMYVHTVHNYMYIMNTGVMYMYIM